MKFYIGVDLGGTNIRAAKVLANGEILETKINATPAFEKSELIVAKIIETIEALSGYQEALAIGMCVPGPVDQKSGSMLMATNIPPLKDVPLVKLISKHFNKEVFMDNDANVAGLAEARVGAGKDKNVVVYITHSTGIGGGIVVNGQLVSGAHGFAGEIANIIVDRTKKSRNHLADGAVENLASGTSMVLRAKELLGEHITDARAIFELKEQGDEKASAIVAEMAYDFAQMCQAIACVLDPDCFVIGGGVSKSAALYLDLVVQNYQKMVHTLMGDVEFVLAKLDEPGLVGAAMLPLSKGF